MDKQTDVAPENKWWVLLACIATIMEPIDSCFEFVQEKDTLAEEQNFCIRTTAEALKHMMKITALTGFDIILSAEECNVMA